MRVYKGVASRKAREKEKEGRRGSFKQLCTREGVISIPALECGVTKFSCIFLQDNNPVSRRVSMPKVRPAKILWALPM